MKEEVALRIALAIKQLYKIDAQDLLRLLIGIMGEPITLAKLNSLRAKTLRKTGADLFAEVDAVTFDKAFALLKGRGIQKYIHPEPLIDNAKKISGNNVGGNMRADKMGVLRVACASNSYENIDGKFSTCVRFLIYSVSAIGYQLTEIREPVVESNALKRAGLRASLVADCSLLYTMTIGAAAAAKLVKAGVHPIQTGRASTALSQIKKLQRVIMKDNPPPWIAKAINNSVGAKKYSDAVCKKDKFDFM